MYYQIAGQEDTVFIRQGDLNPPLEIQLITASDGTYYDISSGSGYININDSSGSLICSGALTITDGLKGKAAYYIQSGDITATGEYDCVFYVESGDGRYVSIPEGDLEYVLDVS